MKEEFRILIPTDYSESADYALEIGITLAQRADAETHILHIEDIPEDWVKLVEKEKSNLYLSINEKLDQVKKQLSDREEKARNAGVKAHQFLEYNKSYRSILGHAENYNADLIVMGAHGLTGIQGLLIGSYTQKVLHRTNVPVLAVRKSEKVNPLKKMTFVSDFSPKYVHCFDHVVRFAEAMDIKLQLLFVNTPSTFLETPEINDRVAEYLKKAPGGLIEKTDVFNAYRFEAGLKDYCVRNEIDLISMMIYDKHHAWRVLGGTIEDMINNLELPVLGIPE